MILSLFCVGFFFHSYSVRWFFALCCCRIFFFILRFLWTHRVYFVCMRTVLLNQNKEKKDRIIHQRHNDSKDKLIKSIPLSNVDVKIHAIRTLSTIHGWFVALPELSLSMYVYSYPNSIENGEEIRNPEKTKLSSS